MENEFDKVLQARPDLTRADYSAMTPKQAGKKIKQLEDEMYRYAKNLEFEQAARLRDEIKKLQDQLLV